MTDWLEDSEYSEFCPCGVTLMGDPDESDGLCGTCAGAPHGRDCGCDECETYWRDIARRSEVAADRFNRRLVCTCGWTGPWPEYHRERGPDCKITSRKDDALSETAA